MNLFPQPKKFEILTGVSGREIAQKRRYVKNEALGQQEYTLRIDETGITVESSTDQGAFYAELTLKQLLDQQPDTVSHCYIHDFPDFKERGVMMDLGRNHVPKLENLKRIVDIISNVKLNHFQLYFEGFPFAYASHPQVWKNKDVLTPEEIMELDAYCKTKFVKLVPCLNAFGHMKHWIQRDEFRDLAIKAKDPLGFKMPWGYEVGFSTLDPELPESWELTKSLFDDLLPCFTADLINICCDETFEIKEKAKEGKDPGRLYIDYVLKIYNYIKSKYPDKTLLFWGDIVEEHPELFKEIPDDLLPILWNYSTNTPPLWRCQMYADAGRYYVCGSTSTHCTIVGKTDVMMNNADCCTVNGKLTGAEGYLQTKWQDLGGWDETCVSYPAFIYGGVQSWNADVKHDITPYLNQYVFMDEANLMAQISMELGDCHHFDPHHWYNGTGMQRILYYDQLDNPDHDLDFCEFPPFDEDYFDKVGAHLDKYAAMLEQTRMTCDDADQLKKEYDLLIRLLQHGVKLGKYRKLGVKDRKLLWELYDDLETIIADYRSGYLARNKNINYENSVFKLYELRRQYIEHLELYRVKV